MKYDINSTCRACLQTTHLIEPVVSGSLRDLFITFTNLEVSENDGLPSKLCASCIEKLKNCSSFLELCINTNRILKQQKTKRINKNQVNTTKVEENDIAIKNIKIGQAKIKLKFCDICKQSFTNLELLKTHMKIHQKQDLTCLECGKTFATKATLRAHKKIHTGVRSFVCHACGKSFGRKNHLQDHIALKHSDEKPFHCSNCPRAFKTASILKMHLLRHKGIKKYVCLTCKYAALTQSDLKKHMASHSNEKPFICKFCPKRYKTYGNLADHNKIHTGVRPYACEFCSMKFRTRRVLRNHTMTHTGEKPHGCTICNKFFIQKIALVSHLKIHEEKFKKEISV